MYKSNFYLSINKIQQALSIGETSIDEIIKHYLDQIEKYNPTLNAYITVFSPQGNEFDHEKPLSGIPVALKDLFETHSIATTAGANFLRNNMPGEDATVVRMLKNAGAIILGKTNMHEIALGVTNINSHYGDCRNPWDIRRISGGSSGGSAVAVASGMCVAALGSDTGGSIRIPASLCGIVGLKPTFGRVSLKGVIPLSWNLDHVGPLTNNVRDAAILLSCITGYDSLDPASCDISIDDYISHIENGIGGWKVAFAAGEYIEESQPYVQKAVIASMKEFEKMGANVVKVEIPWLREAAIANGVMTQADAAAYHYDRLKTSPQVFGDDVLLRLKKGMDCTSQEYARARKIQKVIKRKFKLLFNDYDLLILPTTPSCAPFIVGSDAVEQAQRLTRFTAPFNLAGLPAISLPCGFSPEGLPIGIQIVGPEWSEKKVLMAGRAFERSTNWHEKFPQNGKYQENYS
jgi:aspartyl-tRNA(Asn)/glutamyl-tRNA(Gln) amidotransferase subunit A